MKETKIIVAVLILFVLLLGSSHSSFAGESSKRAVANAAGFHLSALRVNPVAGGDQFKVSGFAPGVGSFNQSVAAGDIKVDYPDGKASVTTTVVTSLGLTIPINVSWTATTSTITQSVSIPNPARTLSDSFKRASVSGTVGTFTIGVGTTGAISQRTVTP